MSEVLLKNLGALEVRDAESGRVWLGGNQYWFEKDGGGACSTTAAANICAYLLRARDGAPTDKDGMLAFMGDVRAHVHPRMEEFGCMAPSFARGLDEVLRGLGLPYRTERLDVPKGADGRAAEEAVRGFLAESLARDLPAAFLNLGRGFVHFSAFFGKGVPTVCVECARDGERPPAVLDDWHWVTVTGVAWDDAAAGGYKPPLQDSHGGGTPSDGSDGSGGLRMRLLDNNDHYWIDLGGWLADARNTGAFVRLVVY
ncbi:MAG: hypothetical protein LBR00_03245 [Clostridiales Family XIII bacterium]|jgi:hypothetical protein|nr:hypothetical protein [Clostridiales Family XIII bacterium]